VTAGKTPRLTWARVGIAFSIGLVVFGSVDAILPRPTLPSATTPNYVVPGLGAPRSPNPHVSNSGTKTGSAVPLRSVPLQSQANTAAQQVAERFVVATDTTDPTHREGDALERAVLAPSLTVSSQLDWPEAWVTADRRTTVVLDPPGPAVAVGASQVAVVVTGRTVVTTDARPSTEVPVDERITLRLIGSPATVAAGSASHWVVTDVGTGS
jgi:hypothetical protein